MRVKHKNNEKNRQDPYTPLELWHKLYLPNDKYLNYEFYDVEKIVDLYEIDDETGNTSFLKSEFVNYADITVKENPKKYFYKPVAENRLDKYLMPKNNLNQSFLLRFKYISYNLPKAKEIIQSITNSTISKWSFKALGIIISVVLLPIFSLIIWELYKVELIKYWKFMFA